MYNLVQKFPHVFNDKNQNLAWPTIIDAEHAEHEFLVTVDTTNFEKPDVHFSYTGDVNVIAKHLIEAIFTQEHFTIAVLQHLAKDHEVIEELLYNPGKN